MEASGRDLVYIRGDSAVVWGVGVEVMATVAASGVRMAIIAETGPEPMSISIRYSLPGLRLREMAGAPGLFPAVWGNSRGGRSYE